MRQFAHIPERDSNPASMRSSRILPRQTALLDIRVLLSRQLPFEGLAGAEDSPAGDSDARLQAACWGARLRPIAAFAGLLPGRDFSNFRTACPKRKQSRRSDNIGTKSDNSLLATLSAAIHF